MLSKHFKSGKFSGYKRMIAGERFYFGSGWNIIDPNDPQQAQTAQNLSDAIELFHRAQMKLQGLSWTPELKEAARQFAKRTVLGIFADPQPFPSPTPTPAPSSPRNDARPLAAASAAPSKTFDEAVKAYLAERLTNVETKDIKFEQYRTIFDRLKALQDAKEGTERVLPNLPLSIMGRDVIRKVVNYWKKRPISKKTKRPLDPTTVKHYVSMLRQFFQWAYDTEQWEGFRAWEREFDVDTDNLKTPLEKKKAKEGKPKYTLDELKALWRKASPRARCYMLLGLNCGMGQTEISTLMSWDIDLGKKIIDRDREKTGIQGQWKLWDETAKYLQIAMDESKEVAARHGKTEAGYALLTEDGFPLVHFTDKTDATDKTEETRRKTDAIGLTWARLNALFESQRPKTVGVDTPLLNRKGETVKGGGKVRRLGFYTLRGTAAQMIRDITTYETSKVFLAHSTVDASGRQSTNEKHYTKRSQADFDKVATALTQMRLALAPVFADDAKKPKRPKTAPKKINAAKGKELELVGA